MNIYKIVILAVYVYVKVNIIKAFLKCIITTFLLFYILQDLKY
jgi:hypothetical protein